MKFALIKESVVIQTRAVRGLDEEGLWVECPLNVMPGFVYDGESFAPQGSRKFALIKQGVVIQTQPTKGDSDSDVWVKCPLDVVPGFIFNAVEESFSPPSAELNTDEKVRRYKVAVSRFIDSQAQDLGYDSIITAVTYADEPADVVTQQEGAALREWRSLCWKTCREILADWEAGGPEPTIEDVLASLPSLIIP
jgi:hypothetical protein